jgi:hypothetical protein
VLRAALVASQQGKELDYEEMDQEHRRLLAIIRDTASSTRQEPPERLVLRAQVPSYNTQQPHHDMPPRNQSPCHYNTILAGRAMALE